MARSSLVKVWHICFVKAVSSFPWSIHSFIMVKVLPESSISDYKLSTILFDVCCSVDPSGSCVSYILVSSITVESAVVIFTRYVFGTCATKESFDRDCPSGNPSESSLKQTNLKKPPSGLESWLPGEIPTILRDAPQLIPSEQVSDAVMLRNLLHPETEFRFFSESAVPSV